MFHYTQAFFIVKNWYNIFMDIGKVLEKAFRYPWKNRTLWFYGVLIAIFSFGTSVSNYTASDEDITQFQSYLNTLNINWTVFWVTLGIIGFVSIIIGVVGMIINAWSKVAIINGVQHIENNKKITRKEIGKTGKKAIWDIIVLTVLIPLVIVLSLIIILVPIVIIISMLPTPINIAVGIIVGLLALFALIPVLVYFGVVWSLAPCAISLQKMKAFEAIKHVRKTIKGKFWITFLFSIVLSIVNGMLIFLFTLPLFILGGLAIYFWFNAIYVAILFGSITFIYLIFMVIVSGYFQAVTQTGWTVWWLELNKVKGKDGKK